MPDSPWVNLSESEDISFGGASDFEEGYAVVATVDDLNPALP